MHRFELRRSGFWLRPLRMSDAPAIARAVFSNPAVAKGLIHDATSPDKNASHGLSWCKKNAIDSPEHDWDTLGFGLWAIVDADPDTDAEGKLVGVRGFFLDDALPDGGLEAFVAIDEAYWRKGISSESSEVLLDYIFERRTQADAVFSNIWPLINPGSEAVQRKLGFEYFGRTSITETFGFDRMGQVRDFEMWRVSEIAAGRLPDGMLWEAAVKMGQLAEEGFHTLDEAQEAIATRIGPSLNASLSDRLTDWLYDGYQNPAFATYRMARSAWLSRRA